MLIKTYRRIELLNILKLANLTLALVFSGLFIWFSYLFLISSLEETSQCDPSEDPEILFIESYANKIDFNDSPLSLDSNEALFALDLIERNLALLSCNDRPGSGTQIHEALISFKGGKEVYPLKKGGSFCIGGALGPYLDTVSDESSHVKISFIDTIGSKCRFLAEVKFPKDDNRGLQPARLIIEKNIPSKPLISTLDNAPFFTQLFEARFYGKDKLFSEYGGGEFGHLANRAKVSFLEGGMYAIYFLKKGDLLAWDGRRWKYATDDKELMRSPVARVQDICSNELVLECWDSSGFYYETVSVPLIQPSSPIEKMESVFSDFKLRTASQLTCRLGKRRVVLKEGDWWLKTPSGWHNLRKLKDLDDCIQHRLKGELFVFDKIVKKHGENYLTGHLFDVMRSRSTYIELPLKSTKSEMGSQPGKPGSHGGRKTGRSKRSSYQNNPRLKAVDEYRVVFDNM